MSKRVRINTTAHDVSLYIDNVQLIVSNFTVIPFKAGHFYAAEDIMHCTYDLKLYILNHDTPQLLYQSTAYEFGALPCLEEHINRLLRANVLTDGMCKCSDNGEIYGIICGHCYGFFHEDNYLIDKCYEKHDDGEEFEWYDLTLSIGGDADCFTSYGAVFNHLQQEDIVALRDFAHECIELAKRIYAEEEYNEI